MKLRSWLLSLFDGRSHRPGPVRKPRKIPVSARAWVKNTSPVPGEPFFEAAGPAMKRHFALADQIEAAWKKHDRRKIVALCEAQIAISSEVQAALTVEDVMNGQTASDCTHTGFSRLAMLYEKEKDYQQAIRVCEQAISEGWLEGEYAPRAARCRKKLAKLSLS